MGNIIRIVVGLGGLTAAAWSARGAWQARRAGQPHSFTRAWVLLGVTAVVMALTLLL